MLVVKVDGHVFTDLYLSEEFWLATGLQIFQCLTPETVFWIQQNTVWLLADKSVAHKVSELSARSRRLFILAEF